MAKSRMYSISIQLSDIQLDRLDIIKEKISAPSYAEIIRNAFDVYVSSEFPELINEEN